ncbi:MAG: filamentous hemagglutinin N-terminal domain-containing protein [Spirulina sp. SIO3F2]|nr:filamentous hemagglutinin N-terminal domain-containing protein [Spirulina sp. SIO3F2]
MRRFQIALLASCFCGLIPLNRVLAQSIIAAPDGTGTVIQIDGNTYQIQGGTQAGANLFHSFQQFGLSSDEIANFLSKPSITNIFGRVTGGNASIIDGLIQANPNLYLMNPAGIVFGANASLNVGGDFFATTADQICFEGGCFNSVGVNDYHTLLGSPTTLGFLQGQPGGLVNAGTLEVLKGKSIHLSGGTVVNLGQILAPGGMATVAAIPGERRVRLNQSGHLLSLEVTDAVLTEGIEPFTLPELLVGVNEPNIKRFVTAQDGTLSLVRPDQVATEGIPITDTPGTVIHAGSIDVSSEMALGGAVNVLGDRIAITNATINASGDRGGGQVRMGGDQQGLGPTPQAQFTYISADSTITADATHQGDGGRIIAFANDTARIYGSLTAQGGAAGGDGGFIETSGLQGLAVTTVPNVGAVAGQGGEWLIDPFNISIVAGSGNSNINTSSPFASTGNNAQLGVDLITAALANGDVTISTGSAGSQNGDINLNTALNFTLATERTLTLNAHRRIRIRNPIQGTVGTAPLNVVLNGNNGDVTSGTGNIYITSSIITGGGDITARGRATTKYSQLVRGVEITSTGSLDSGGGEINLTGYTPITAFQGVVVNGPVASGGGNITITGSGEYSQAILIGNTVNSDGGDITFKGTGLNQRAITIGSNVTSGGGDITLTGYSTNNHAIYLNQSVDSGGGHITITGTTGNASRNGIRLRNSLVSGSGDLTLSADRLHLSAGGSPSLSGTGNLTLQPVDPSQNLTVGGTGGSSATFLNNTELGRIQDGFSAITIGRADGSGTISLADNVTFNDPVTLQSSSGTIDTTGFTLSTNNDGITLIGELVNAGAIASGTGNILLSGNEIDLNSPITGTGTLTVQSIAASQAIQVGSVDTGSGSILDLTATDLTQVQDGFSTITIGRTDGSGTITLADSVTGSGANPFTDPVAIAGGSTLVGPNQTTTWSITGANQGTLSGFTSGLSFRNIENLTGGEQPDTFVFSDGATISGIIDGSNPSTIPGDTLDFSAYTTIVFVDLANGTAMPVGQVLNIETAIVPEIVTLEAVRALFEAQEDGGASAMAACEAIPDVEIAGLEEAREARDELEQDKKVKLDAVCLPVDW